MADDTNDNTHYEEAQRLLRRTTLISNVDLQTHILGNGLLAVADAAEAIANSMERLASLLECPHGRSVLVCTFCGVENPA